MVSPTLWPRHWLQEESLNHTKKEGEKGDGPAEEINKGNHVVRKLEKRQQEHKLDPHIEEQFGSGRLLAAISSYPG